MSFTSHRKGTIVIAMMALLAFATIASAAESVLRDRNEIADMYKWNLSDIYSDWDAWEADMTRLKVMMDEYAALQGTLVKGPEALLKAFRLHDELDQLTYPVYRYPGLSQALDRRDNDIGARFQRVLTLLNQFSTATAWFNPEMLAIPWETMKEWLDNEEGLASYRHGIEDLYRQQAHVLSEDKEKLVSYFASFNRSPRDIYSELSTSDIQFPEIAFGDGDTVRLTAGQYRLILATNRNQDERARAMEEYYGVYHANVNTYAAIYNSVLQRNWGTAQARNYGSCLESFLDGDNVPTEVYETLVETVAKGMAPYRKYYQLRKQVLGLEEYHLYDGSIPMTDFEKTYEYDEAVEWVIEAMAPLGKDYQDMLRKAVDNRWIDVYESEGKRGGAFSANTYGVHPYVLMNFNGILDHVFTLAHELGHAMHSVLSNANQPYATSSYTIFVAEVASTLDEALLLEYMYKRTEDPRERVALLDQAINNILGTFYTQTIWADFELRMHREVEQGKPVTAESIRQLYYDLEHQYHGDAVVFDDLYKSTWARIGHFYRSPFYVYKYATSFAASAKLAEQILGDDKELAKDALERHMTLLKSGGNDYPMELLKKAGVDMADPATYQAVVDRLDLLVSRLEEELAKL